MLAGEWGQAARRLEHVEAPEGAGLGKATIDYWFGRSLLAEAGSGYRAVAREALARAAEAADARFGDNDGPLVAPRALTRLRQLEGAAE